VGDLERKKFEGRKKYWNPNYDIKVEKTICGILVGAKHLRSWATT
jgi:hypothetical protein